MRNRVAVCLGVLLAMVLASLSSAQEPRVVWTKISLTELHCKSCLKKITKHLDTVPGVGGVQGHLPTASVYVQHRPGMNPSPRALWEAIIEADHTPTKLEGPFGTFVQKPQQ